MDRMKRILQVLRKKYGVTPEEYVLLGFFFYVVIVIGAKAIEPSLNTKFLFSPASAFDRGGVTGDQRR
jgi:Flp pilus assembly pilin Flp